MANDDNFNIRPTSTIFYDNVKRAVISGDDKTVQQWLSGGEGNSDPDIISILLNKAVGKGHQKIVSLLATVSDIRSLRYALFRACLLGHENIVSWLVRNVCVELSLQEYSALIASSILSSRENIVKWLIDNATISISRDEFTDEKNAGEFICENSESLVERIGDLPQMELTYAINQLRRCISGSEYSDLIEQQGSHMTDVIHKFDHFICMLDTLSNQIKHSEERPNVFKHCCKKQEQEQEQPDVTTIIDLYCRIKKIIKSVKQRGFSEINSKQVGYT